MLRVLAVVVSLCSSVDGATVDGDPELNSTAGDSDPELSADHRAVLFSSARSGRGDTYQATR